MRRFEVRDAQFLQETPAARLWKVVRAGGEPAVLKLYVRGHMGNEATGVAYLRRAQPHCAQVYEACEEAVLLEWLAGPSSGDHARLDGEAGCRAADETLAEVAITLARADVSPAGLQPVEALFAPLVQAKDLPTGAMRAAQARAEGLLRTPLHEIGTDVALHGDLHPDNIRLHHGRWRAFDAKGLRGSRAYELANAFRHPRGCADYLCAPQTIDRRVTLWSQALGCPPQELLAWSIAKTALSLVWRKSAAGADMDLLQALLSRM